jgi:hypothetical protein
MKRVDVSSVHNQWCANCVWFWSKKLWFHRTFHGTGLHVQSDIS